MGPLWKTELFLFSLINHSVLFHKANVALGLPTYTATKKGPWLPGVCKDPKAGGAG